MTTTDTEKSPRSLASVEQMLAGIGVVFLTSFVTCIFLLPNPTGLASVVLSGVTALVVGPFLGVQFARNRSPLRRFGTYALVYLFVQVGVLFAVTFVTILVFLPLTDANRLILGEPLSWNFYPPSLRAAIVVALTHGTTYLLLVRDGATRIRRALQSQPE